MLSRAEQNKGITRLPSTRGGTRINHLFFTDNSLLFCKANVFEWQKIQDILRIYKKALRQNINREKTSIFISKNTKEASRAFILSTVGVNSTQSYEKYLVLPALIGRSCTCSFKGIQGRIWERLSGWKEKKFIPSW